MSDAPATKSEYLQANWDYDQQVADALASSALHWEHSCPNAGFYKGVPITAAELGETLANIEAATNRPAHQFFPSTIRDLNAQVADARRSQAQAEQENDATRHRNRLLVQALVEEQTNLWSDLATAKHDAANGEWSVQCDWLVDRIKSIVQLVDPTHWTYVPVVLLVENVYQSILDEVCVAYEPPDPDRLDQIKSEIEASGVAP